MEQLRSSLNKLWVGLVAGIVGPVFGALIFYAIFFGHKTIVEFAQMIINTSSTHSALLSVSLIFNLVFFFIAIRLNWMNAVRGVITAMFIYAPVIVYFKYLA
jgi:hypothetical protein